MKGIELYGKDWKKVQQLVGTRTSAQSRSHAQKVLSKTDNSKQQASTFATPKSPVKEKEVNMKYMELPSEKNTNMSMNNEKAENKNNSEEVNSSDHKDINRKRGHEDRLNEFKDLPTNVKRKCTLDVSSLNPVDELLINDDDLSLKLLRKLTTPQKPARFQSFCYPLDDYEGLKIEFNSDIDSLDHEEPFQVRDFTPDVILDKDL